jgi:hypothetical protein
MSAAISGGMVRECHNTFEIVVLVRLNVFVKAGTSRYSPACGPTLTSKLSVRYALFGIADEDAISGNCRSIANSSLREVYRPTA